MESRMFVDVAKGLKVVESMGSAQVQHPMFTMQRTRSGRLTATH